MRIEPDIKLDYSDVLMRPKRSTLGSRKAVDLQRRFTYHNYKPGEPGKSRRREHGDFLGIPLMASNMDGVGTFEMADTLAKQRIFTCLVKTYSVNELVSYFDVDTNDRKNNVAMSIGILDHDHQKFRDVYEQTGNKLKYVCIDVANGYSERFLQFINTFRSNYPEIVIIAGNVVTSDQTQELILNGADIVKVGIGPGSVCTTRLKTGVGYPQLSAVIECADAAHGLGGHIIADGGCTCPGDVAKAFAGGADFVMLGGMLAGHNEGGGEVIVKKYVTNEMSNGTNRRLEEKSFVQFYGMSSKTANEKHFEGLKDYRSSEGRTALVPYRGEVNSTIQDILGGVRSACTYVGANKLKRLSKCATFIQVSNQLNTIYESSTTGE
ncbi:MAG: GMP reductase [Euryarchaeota archaeon]|jgi:GMP reductase|nr:GMP reductase [Euryarchaeota archaeon]